MRLKANITPKDALIGKQSIDQEKAASITEALKSNARTLCPFHYDEEFRKLPLDHRRSIARAFWRKVSKEECKICQEEEKLT